MRRRAELIGRIQIAKSQYNRPDFQKKISYRKNRAEVIDHFSDPVVQKNVGADLAVTAELDRILNDLELYIARHAETHDAFTFHLLRSIPGIGKILALVILYEVHDIERFPTVQQFASYARLVKCPKESAGKRYGYSGAKIGNAHLKWAFSEAAVLFLRHNPAGQKILAQLEHRHGKGKALTVLAHKLARAVYYRLKRQTVFDMETFLHR
jgi:transposase